MGRRLSPYSRSKSLSLLVIGMVMEGPRGDGEEPGDTEIPTEEGFRGASLSSGECELSVLESLAGLLPVCVGEIMRS